MSRQKRAFLYLKMKGSSSLRPFHLFADQTRQNKFYDQHRNECIDILHNSPESENQFYAPFRLIVVLFLENILIPYKSFLSRFFFRQLVQKNPGDRFAEHRRLPVHSFQNRSYSLKPVLDQSAESLHPSRQNSNTVFHFL